ncbi:MAG TPA: pitrilysin family protein [Burkholderiales bacterium]|nr:pitrilysin family protein [Burkholderiales bacterium]
MRRFLAVLLLAGLLPGFLPPALGQAALDKVRTVAGITEYRLENGLRVLMLPDPGADTITVHVTYRVGSRHEGYGEKGMAHLLEHLLFKGSPRHPDPKAEMAARGARWNGTTSMDRTTYFETFAPSPENLDWALSLEADRMVNAYVRKSDLESEMTVVRNEFEMGENSPGSVLYQRMQQTAFQWHNYGNPIIGARSDIEQVPIGRLQAFYRTWYQPDNALLIIGGRFDEAHALELVRKHFGPIPKPARELPALYTEEPTQDGERNVVLRRVGDHQLVQVLYRVPAASDPSYPAVDILTRVLGEAPSGRLHRALVQKGLASVVWGAERGLHDPGFIYFGASLSRDADLAAAREALLATVEGVKTDPVRPEELERARTSLLNDFEKTELETGSLVRALAEFEAMGDWRLFFLYRDRLEKVTLEDVQRVANDYLRRSNRVVGVFIPTDAPERAEIPPRPDLEKALEGYTGGESVRLGEAFDPSPENIEARVVRRSLANGIRAAFLPKKTRGGRVVVKLDLHWGSTQSLMHRDVACSLAGGMLTRGTEKRTRAELKDAFERLNASVQIDGEGVRLEVRSANLEPALRLVAEALTQPSFPRSEFEELKRAAITGAEAQRSDPSARASVRLSRHLYAYPTGHPHYTPTVDERIDWLRATTLEDAMKCYRELMGATGATIAAVGELDPDALARLVESLFGGWKTPQPFERVPVVPAFPDPVRSEIVTPDKANAVLRAGFNLKMRDDHPDFPALVLANYLLGGTSTARLPARVREKEGLSYSTYTSFGASPFDEAASFRVGAIYAPANRARVEQAVREELARALREGFGEDEVAAGRKALLEARQLARTQDRALAERLAAYLFADRTFAWDIALEKRIASLSAEEVNAALRRHFDAGLSLVAAGDFRQQR